MTRAALFEQAGAPLLLTEIEVASPGPGEVVVDVAATGVCHSDVGVFSGKLPAPVPLVLGHEGAGVVAEVGAGVDDLAVGDHVVLSWLANCGTCYYCQRAEQYLCGRPRTMLGAHTLPDGSTRMSLDGTPVRQFCGLGTFSQRTVVPAGAAIRISDRVPIASAALLGCGVLTGFGAAVKTGRVRVGDAVAVIGCGGVGLNAVQGARIAGATTIIAIDVHTDRLALATRLGATHTLTAGPDVVKQVQRLTGRRGADVVIEVAGRQETVNQAVAMARRGGTAVLVGAGPGVGVDEVFNNVVMSGKTVKGCLYGSAYVKRDIPQLVELYERGALLLDELVTETFGFDDIAKAVDYCAGENGARAVVLS
ncbi:Zn-dependent alcohol dehydrogenase [Nocardia ignorata]|uniref:Alcohol dehydrogenase/S-(Hydroxymethyl)glutathione dehydrogenase/alcohol dehydrogenase n=1 Tax=Nocardia ignorata TaxID=145285 RepID=A0A4R6PM30_NOCIG|nr:Zn-dependent alcohol dehydrogenase [Nocardia ignorata]TDP37829.1 alcohol dehydrogenase/S-(hydroxymethyl)glutathione dehydrogenase/alcohol dehydrogenase [Nocardia ignorata]